MKLSAALFVAGLACLMLPACDRRKSVDVDIPSAQPDSPSPVANDGFTQSEREQFYHLAEGSEIFPVKWMLALHSSKTERPFLDDIERFGLIPDPGNPGGLPIGLTAEKSKDLQFASMKLVGITCAACHTAQFTYRGKSILVDGAPGLFDVEAFYRELADSASETAKNPGKFVLFLDRYGKLPKDPQPVPAALRPDALHTGDLDDLAAAPDVPADPAFTKGPEGINRLIGQRVRFLQRLNKNQSLGGPGGGFGRTDAFGRLRGVLFGDPEMATLDAPVSYPALWGFADRTWMHWDGNTNSALERNIGQALGLGAAFDAKHLTTSILIHNLRRLEELARKIPVPRWPEELFGKLDAKKVERGRRLYAANCADCHDAGHSTHLYAPEELGTDTGRLKNFARDVRGVELPAALHSMLTQVKDAAFAHARPIIADNTRAAWDNVGTPEWRNTAKYVARPLQGIWATPPYLHNGSVPSLDDLLRPAAARPREFPLGHREYDPIKIGYRQDVPNPRGVFNTDLPGNSNAGHEFGAAFNAAERLDLLEFLKSPY